MADDVLARESRASRTDHSARLIIWILLTYARSCRKVRGFDGSRAGKGEDAARVAAEQAISSQLLDITIDGARGILFNVTRWT